MKTIHNVETNEIVERDFTEEEIQQQIIDQQMIDSKKAELEAKAEQKRILLEKLGITDEEAKLLLS